MAVYFEGLRTVQGNLARAIRQIEGRTAKGVLKAALLVAREAKIRTPIETGNLRNSQMVTSENLAGEPSAAIAYQAAYAPFVHERMEPVHPVGQAKFLEHAVDENTTRIIEIIRQEAQVR